MAADCNQLNTHHVTVAGEKQPESLSSEPVICLFWQHGGLFVDLQVIKDST